MFGSYGRLRVPIRHRSMLGRCGTGSLDSASTRTPLRKPGRVTRRAIVTGSWQSTHETGCSTSLVASAKSMAHTTSKPLKSCSCPVGEKEGVGERARRALLQADGAVGGQIGGVALHAGAGLLPLRDPLGLALVREHVGVPALLSVVDREGVPGEEHAPARVLVELLERLRPAEARALNVNRAQVPVVLARKVLPPLRRIQRALGEGRQPEARLPRLALPLPDVLPQQHDPRRAHAGDHGHEQVDQCASFAALGHV